MMVAKGIRTYTHICTVIEEKCHACGQLLVMAGKEYDGGSWEDCTIFCVHTPCIRYGLHTKVDSEVEAIKDTYGWL